jgi:iron(III) transport system permease protein
MNSWTLLAIAIALLVSIPVLFVASSIFVNSGDVWQHLAATVLGDYIANSLLLALGVSAGVLIIGVGTAWLVTMCDFWGSRCFEVALLLPLAAPAYLLAYAYNDMLDYYGPVQSLLRAIFGWQTIQDYCFPSIRSIWGAIAMLSLVLYPYVYLITRVAFLEQSTCTLEASRSLGCNPWHSFFTIALPLARPSIFAGLSLALMETLNDLGTVEYFGIATFTTGIYRTWLGMEQKAAAAQLASCLMLFVFILIVMERWSRDRSRYYQKMGTSQELPKYQLGWLRGIFSWLACFLPIGLGFILPASFLLQMALSNIEATIDASFWSLAGNSFLLASITAGIGVIVALILAYGQRLQSNLPMRLAVRISAMGYAIPGSVIAVGILIPLGQFDNAIDAWFRSTLGISTGLLLSGTIFALIFAYLVRFLAVGLGAVESSLQKITPNIDNAARSLGRSPTKTLIEVHAPMMWGGLLTSAMLVFVDVMKELSATLVIRPFNFDTLAVRVYQYASDERLIEASAPAIAIVLVGLLPVILLSWRIASSRSSPQQERQLSLRE